MTFAGNPSTTSDWRDAYSGLDLRGGRIEFFYDDEEDMITINYEDGMLIDVGRYGPDQLYGITVVSSADERGWSAPLAVICVEEKKDLPTKIQEAIFKYRPI